MKNVSTKFTGVKRGVTSISLAMIMALAGNSSAIAETGITPDKIIIGGVMDLEGRSRGLGRGMRDGINAAFDGQKVKGRSIEFTTLNDSYNPSKTIAATEQLVGRGHSRVCETVEECQEGSFDVAVDSADRILVLDTHRNDVRIFVKKKAD